jgi:hypothetical protein
VRWLIAIVMLAGCDRVFGIGDPYEDAPPVTQDMARAADAPADQAAIADVPGAMPIPIAHWAFDDNLIDSVSGQTGTCTNSAGIACAFMPGQHGDALDFDGSTCAAFPFSAKPTALTILVWIDPVNGGAGMVLDRGVSASHPTADAWLLEAIAPSVKFTTSTASQPDVETLGYVVPNDAWTHLALTFDTSGKSIIVYDGSTAHVTVEASPGPIVYGSATSLFVGCHGAATTTTYYSGRIDDIYIFDRALMPAEIAMFR